jgi:hypothetical protein
MDIVSSRHRWITDSRCKANADSVRSGGHPNVLRQRPPPVRRLRHRHLTAAVKTAKAQLKLDVPYRPGQVDDKQLTPRFCLLGALSGRSVVGDPLMTLQWLQVRVKPDHCREIHPRAHRPPWDDAGAEA